MSENFKSMYNEFIYKRTYSRWLEDKKRREDWLETIKRYEDFFLPKIPQSKQGEFKRVCRSIYELNVMPSMRSLWTAGKALERESIAGYNCAYTIIDNIKAFAELFYILLNGTGCGYSVERQNINKLPNVPNKFKETDKTIIFADSKLGWVKGFYDYLKHLYNGEIPNLNYDKIRPEGERLKTFGGRASGSGPLKRLNDFVLLKFKAAAGRKLNSLECHDICCMIANIVTVGGVRRSACISLSNLSDERLRHCKDGNFNDTEPQRALSNNSVAYTEQPDAATFLTEWLSLIRSKSGERGIVNREALEFTVKSTGRRELNGHAMGVNPCCEIILRPNSFCNLSEVVIRSEDTIEELKKKVRHATILGCVQSTLTNFTFLGRDWKNNCEDERLLGVSLTGLRDHAILGRKSRKAQLMLTEMKQIAIDTAKEWSDALEINMPAAITTVKPSGTVSQLVDSSSGLHARHAPYYIRRVRVSTIDPICQLLIDKGIPNSPEVGQSEANCNTRVFDFSAESPKDAVMREDINAIEQLEYWKMLKRYWCEHSPSCTIYCNDNEWLEVGNWVYKNWNYVSGLSFLPKDGGSYLLAPFEEITEEEYNDLVAKMPRIDFNELTNYELEDFTSGAKEVACSGGVCEII